MIRAAYYAITCPYCAIRAGYSNGLLSSLLFYDYFLASQDINAFLCRTIDAVALQVIPSLIFVEGIAADLIEELGAQGLTNANCDDLEKHAYSVNDGIEDAGIRNMHILAGT